MKKSIIHKLSDSEFSEIVLSSKNWTAILKKVGLKPVGSNHVTLKKRVKLLNLDISHFDPYFRSNVAPNKRNKKEAFQYVTNGTCSSKTLLKKYLKEFLFIPYVCNECDSIPFWNNLPLTLQLDHIDGDSLNDHLSNLRWLCPNCHSQTKNFAGRNKLKLVGP